MSILDAYKAVIFDWDGTLVDTCGLVLDAHNHVRAHYNHPLWTMDDFLGRASQSAREYYPTVYGEQSDEAQILLYQYVEENHLESLEIMNHSKELLDLLTNLEIPLGIVSNKRHKILNIEIDHMDWRSYFKAAIGAGKAKKDKPAIAPLLMTLAQMDKTLIPSDILYVGDTETDLIHAQNAQCDIAFIQSDKPRPDLIEKYAPQFAFNDLKGLMDKVESLNTGLNKAC